MKHLSTENIAQRTLSGDMASVVGQAANQAELDKILKNQRPSVVQNPDGRNSYEPYQRQKSQNSRKNSSFGGYTNTSQRQKESRAGYMKTNTTEKQTNFESMIARYQSNAKEQAATKLDNLEYDDQKQRTKAMNFKQA